MTERHVSRVITLFAVTLLFGNLLFAQAISGELVGAVLDASGAAVPSATVSAVNVETGVVTNAQTTESGEYRIRNLPPGRYNITATAAGFSAANLKDVAMEINKTATVNLTMQIGQVSTTVEVTEAPSVIDTTTAQIQSTFEVKQAEDLPVSSIGLGVLNLSLLNAGVASNGGLGAGDGPAVGGQRPRNNNFTVEGVDNNNKAVTGPLTYIPNDAVAEFTLLQNQFSPEFGHSSGGQFNTVVKSGTNAFHGAAYDYFQNRNLNAIDQVLQNQAIASGQRPENPRFDSNRLGGQFGGPIRKNKLFFFSNFEYNPTGLSITPAAVSTPTATGFAALDSIPGLNQTNLGILKQYATPAPVSDGTVSVAGVNVPVGTLPLASSAFINWYYNVNSVDYNLSDRDQIRGRFIYNRSDQTDVQATLPAFYTAIPLRYYLATIAEYHNFSPNLTNEFRIGYNRYSNAYPAGNFKFPGLDSFPNLTFDELGLNLGPDPNAPQFGVQNTYQFVENLSWVKGKHTLKFGIDGRKIIAPQSFTQRARGDYDYSTLEMYLLDLTPDQLAQRSSGNVTYYGDEVQLYPYVNDTWRLRPNLSLNLGMRYEFSSVPYSERLQSVNSIANVPGVLTFQKPQPQYHNFAPRVGLAYSPGRSGNTSFRAGFGMAYDVIFDNIGILSLPPQFSITNDVTGATLPNGQPVPNFLANGGILANTAAGPLDRATAIASTSAYIPNQKLPYSIQWNFGVQHVFAKDYTLEARYLGTRGVHLDVQQRINVTSDVTPGHSLPTYLTNPGQSALDALPLTLADLQSVPHIVPQFLNAGFTNNIVENAPIGNSTYHGLALQATRRFSKGLQFVGAYTWSHLIDDSTADFFTTLLTPRRPQDFQNLRTERGSSALDRRQRFTLTAIYDVPLFQHSNWVMKNLVGNWEIAPIYTYESPEYVTVQSAQDSNLNGDTFTDRALINPSGTPGTGTDVTPLTNSNGDVVAYLANNPGAYYIRAGKGVFPSGGRNTLAGRPINNFDLTLVKRFSIKERFKTEFQAQFLNAFNHPQFTPGFVDRVDNPAVLNTGASVRNYLTPGSSIFNNPEAIYSSNPRAIQLVLKVLF